MGRFQKRRKKGGSNKNQRDDRDKGQKGDNYELTVADVGNFKMESYYSYQGLHNAFWNEQGELVPCTTDEEKNAERMRYREGACKILPSSFRIGKDVPPVVREQVAQELQTLLESSKTEEFGQVLFKLNFLPHAYQLNLDRTTIKKSPKLTDLHEWLKTQTAAGFISRQETVSMIPTTILGVQPADLVLDMCAAPGSKSAQLLEDLGPSGCLVANDSNHQRAHMLVHQLKRIVHSNPVLLVTNCDGQIFPATPETQFDKILCDVPCSGDGTTRKNIGIWKRWGQLAALGLHRLQISIAWRGVHQLLKINGMQVYSTCSLNPIENEAVVAELLRKSDGGLELVSCELQGFKTRPGMSSWKVMCESKSRLEMKNDWKKNSPKMQAKRAQFEKDNATKVDQTDVPDADQATKPDDLEETAKTSKAKVNAETVAVEQAKEDADAVNVDGKESAEGEVPAEKGEQVALAADRARVRQKFEPTSMSEEALFEMTKTAGLVQYDTYDDVPAHLQTRIKPSAFPPTPEEVAQFHLERCHRCLPQDNNTGGFFVALFRKIGPLGKVDRRAEAAKQDPTTEESSEPDAKKARMENTETAPEAEGEDNDPVKVDDADLDDLEVDEENKPSTFKGGAKSNLMQDNDGKYIPGLGKDDFVPVSDEIMDPIIDFYGFDRSTFLKDHCMTRACGDIKVIYYIGQPVKDLIDLGFQKLVTVVNSGLKAFSRNNKNNATLPYRICQEAVHFLAPHMLKRRIVASVEDITKCYGGMSMSLTTFSDKFAAEVRPLGVGAFVVVLDGYEKELGQKLIATMWRARGDNIDCLVAKVEIEGVQTKLKVISTVQEKAKAS